MVANALQLSGALLTMIFILAGFTNLFGKAFIHSHITYVVAKVNGMKDKVETSVEAGLVIVAMFYVALSYSLPLMHGENLWLGDFLYSIYLKIAGSNSYVFVAVKIIVFNLLVVIFTYVGVRLGKWIGKRLLYRELNKKKR